MAFGTGAGAAANLMPISGVHMPALGGGDAAAAAARVGMGAVIVGFSAALFALYCVRRLSRSI